MRRHQNAIAIRPLDKRGACARGGVRTLIAAIVAFLSVATTFADAPRVPLRGGRVGPNSGGVVQAGVEADDEIAHPALRRGNLPQGVPVEPDAPAAAAATAFSPEQLVSPGGLPSTLRLMMLMTVLSLAPSILMMTTCFVRFAIVLGLLRQALGTPQLPPNQVLTALCLFLTFFTMSPVWQESYSEGVRPYTQPAAGETPLEFSEAFNRAVRPLHRFMSEQIDHAGNGDTVWMLLDHYQPNSDRETESYDPPRNYEDVPLSVLASSYLLSELKVGFLIGFRIFLPFLVLDLVVATVLTTLGMMTVPPTLVSFPFKLLLFVLIDGWSLTVGMLLQSVRPVG